MPSLSVPSLSGEGSLTRYLQEIRKFPMLEPEEEYMLAKRWKEREDSEAAHRLVTSHLRLVAKIAMGYRGYGLPLSELISEGNVGMMQAVKRFDPDRGFRLATYAMWWIRAAIQEYILHSWSLVKMGTTAAQKKLFFNLRKLKGQLQAVEDGDLSPENLKKIATELDVPEADVISMNRRLASPDHSLNAPLRSDSEGEWQDWLVDESESQETKLADRQELGLRRDLLEKALTHLNERERHILGERRLKDNPTTLEDLSQHYGISRERVRQIAVVQDVHLPLEPAQIEEQLLLGSCCAHLHQRRGMQHVFLNRRADPPHRIGCQAESTIRIEPLDRLHHADIAFADQVAVRQAVAAITGGDARHQTQVRRDQFVGRGGVAFIAPQMGEAGFLLGRQHRHQAGCL